MWIGQRKKTTKRMMLMFQWNGQKRMLLFYIMDEGMLKIFLLFLGPLLSRNLMMLKRLMKRSFLLLGPLLNGNLKRWIRDPFKLVTPSVLVKLVTPYRVSQICLLQTVNLSIITPFIKCLTMNLKRLFVSHNACSPKETLKF